MRKTEKEEFQMSTFDTIMMYSAFAYFIVLPIVFMIASLFFD